MAAAPELLLLQNAELFDPAPQGRRDLLIAGGRVVAIAERLDPLPASLAHEVVDLEGATLAPGLIDAHVHVTGGGGEAGYSSRVPALTLSQLTRAGVTSVVGLLGTDAVTRTMRELLAHTRALRAEGLGAWCWTGNYEVPVKTFTGSVRDDMVFLEAVIGVGELAISDHRSSQPTFDEFLRVAADVHVGGLMTGKAGVLHLHLGDGERGLGMVRDALDRSELPARVFHPTHINRNHALFEEAQALVRDRGERAPFVDLTAFPADDVGDGLSAAAGIAAWKRAGLSFSRLTCSSDGGGCMPHFDDEGQVHGFGVGQSTTLLETLREAVGEHGLSLAELLPLFTSNVAGLLRLAKGRVAVGGDADLMILDAKLNLQGLLAGGRWMIRAGEPVTWGAFEQPASGHSSDHSSDH
ncbi:beta-aspartyl-peptidase [Pseudenhygromyxa sp. WMMC2535]|uniref:beta-aspartyl-peptidase n=1 Tax=Pseudenhygromyxa sp. WMMC2535 TaxID=2712867 RepID=UPI001552F9FB|nr:beta-aspartyl-peptidase [Pseudenhygromyxa sp. WMMC2535]NVB42243.1 beta-aspartyl-peptidase [Pseudenhygromyxa sp. WMMC2535]